ncbi:MAG: hypothetical protein FWD89_00580 [Firmicutes bacterium]|nr:hypothetical protein [Bacillota bacterium]
MKMTKLRKFLTTGTIVLSLAAVYFLPLFAFVTFSPFGNNNNIFNTSAPTIANSISISNPDFDQSSAQGSNRLALPTEWAKIEGSRTDAVIYGVAETGTRWDREITKVDNPSGTRPDRPNDNILVMHAEHPSVPASVGFRSANISLQANSFYSITFWAHSGGVGEIPGGAFSAYLVDHTLPDTDEDFILSYFFPASRGGWSEFTFFIETNTVMSKDVSLELWLGGRNHSTVGAVFFDRLETWEYSEHDFFQATAALRDGFERFVSVDKNNRVVLDNSTPGFNFGFSDELGDTIAGQGQVSEFEINSKSEGPAQILRHEVSGSTNLRFNDENIPLGSNGSVGNTHALLFNTQNDTAENHAFVEIASNPFNISMQGIYMLSVWARTNTTGIASAVFEVTNYFQYDSEDKLEEVNKSTLKEQKESGANRTSISIESSNAEIRNGWQRYSFIIEGHSHFITEGRIALALGTETEYVAGWVAFDDVELIMLTEEERQATHALQRSTRVVLSAQGSGSSRISNGGFVRVDSIEWSDNTPSAHVVYPIAAVSNWSHTACEIELERERKDRRIEFGIVNTNPTHFQNTVPHLINPGLTELQSATAVPSNNVLYMGNGNVRTHQSFSSESFFVAQGSHSRIDVRVHRPQAVGNSYITVQTLGGLRLGELTVLSSPNGQGWQTYSFFIGAGITPVDAQVVLHLGKDEDGQGAEGRVFFDMVRSEDISKTDFDAQILDTNQTRIINLKRENFNAATEVFHGDFLRRASMFTTETTAQAHDIGVFTAAGTGVPGELQGIAPVNPNIPNILKIRHITPSVTSLSYNTNFTFSSEEFYRVRIFVQTERLTVENDHLSTAQNPLGLNIELTGLGGDNAFSGIRGTTDGFIEHSFYIGRTTASDVRLNIDVGTDGHRAIGNVFINTIEAEIITREEFEAAKVPPMTPTSARLNIIEAAELPLPPLPPDDFTPEPDPFNWLYIPSILLGLAILIVVARVSYNNYKKKRFEPADKTVYRMPAYKKLFNRFKKTDFAKTLGDIATGDDEEFEKKAELREQIRREREIRRIRTGKQKWYHKVKTIFFDIATADEMPTKENEEETEETQE